MAFFNGIEWKVNEYSHIVETIKRALQKRYNERNRHGTHASDVMYCPRLVVLRKLFPRASTSSRELLYFLRGEYVHKGIQGLLEEYAPGRFIMEKTKYFTDKEICYITNEPKDYTIQSTPDIHDSLLSYIVDIKSMNKTELPYGPDASHLNQLSFYMTITGVKKGQLLYVLLTNNDENPFRTFDVTITDELREQTKKRLIRETRDIEDATESKNPSLVRHVRFDSRYNWKCNYCSHRSECDDILIKEIPLKREDRLWWDKGYDGKQRKLSVPKPRKKKV